MKISIHHNSIINDSFDQNSQKGAVLVIVSFFMMAMISLLALSVDGHFLLQSRLEEQNVTEYFSIATLSGYLKTDLTGTDDEFTERRNNALVFLKSMEGTNSIFGLKSDELDFQSYSCEKQFCQGNNWSILFGQWLQYGNSGEFIAAMVVEDDPPFVEPTSVNAVKFTLNINKKSTVSFFTKYTSDNSQKTTSSIAFLPNESFKKIRIAKITATGHPE